jgi:hypothetical protein
VHLAKKINLAGPGCARDVRPARCDRGADGRKVSVCRAVVEMNQAVNLIAMQRLATCGHGRIAVASERRKMDDAGERGSRFAPKRRVVTRRACSGVRGLLSVSPSAEAPLHPCGAQRHPCQPVLKPRESTDIRYLTPSGVHECAVAVTMTRRAIAHRRRAVFEGQTDRQVHRGATLEPDHFGPERSKA